MVADIRLLQGKVVEDPGLKPKNVSKLIHELALEILSDEEAPEAQADAQADSKQGSAREVRK
jgi:hypothetical protein